MVYFILFFQGSGKTLAFGIPVLHFILEQKKREADKNFNGKFFIYEHCPIQIVPYRIVSHTE